MARARISKFLSFEAITLKPVAPDDTNIKQLGLSRDAAAKLSSKVGRLTKKDLVALHLDPEGEQKRLDLSAADINSITKAFSTHLQISARAAENGGISVTVASCCTPCCCAAAVSVEVAVQ
jgi:hypothetical protein